MVSDRTDRLGAAAPPQRLKRRAEFLLVAARGRKIATKGLVLQALAAPQNLGVRIGFTVTKKLGNAVARNRAKRRLREAMRLHLHDHAVAPADLVLVGRGTTAERRFHLLRGDLAQAIEKAGLG